MKNFENTIVKGILILLLFTFGAVAQNTKIETHKMSHDLADNKVLHAAEITILPGEKTDMHTHPAHFIYALSEGKLMVHFKDGKEELIELKPGFSMYGEPERPHISENVGTTAIKFVIVELKEHPYKEGKTKK